jgi:hypothetical protein
MRDVSRRFPDDLDAATLLADALMNLRPWSLWTPEGAPQPGTEEIVVTLERVLAADPTHPGANHLYIHAVEASPDPRRAEAAADRLRGLMPGAGHMVHMPSHIYYRVGRYADAAIVNVQAVAADRAYFARSRLYRMMYYPHNLDFVWHAAALEGRGAECLRAAREFAAAAPPEVVLEMPDMETAPAAPYFALVRFGRWSEMLAEPVPPARMLYVTGAWRYGRGLALLATCRRDEAAGELTQLRAIRQSVPPERTLARCARASAPPSCKRAARRRRRRYIGRTCGATRRTAGRSSASPRAFAPRARAPTPARSTRASVAPGPGPT